MSDDVSIVSILHTRSCGEFPRRLAVNWRSIIASSNGIHRHYLQLLVKYIFTYDVFVVVLWASWHSTCSARKNAFFPHGVYFWLVLPVTYCEKWQVDWTKRNLLNSYDSGHTTVGLPSYFECMQIDKIYWTPYEHDSLDSLWPIYQR